MFTNILVLVFCLAGVVFGVLLAVVGIKSFKEKNLIKKTPTSKIGRLTKGLVEISGEVTPCNRELFIGPLSNHECVYYKYTMEEYHPEHSVIKWKSVKSGEEKKHFYLKDETGTVLIDPQEADISSLSADYEFETSFSEDPPENIKRILRQNDIDYQGFFGINKKMRFSEYLIVPGDRLFILGTAVENPFLKDSSSGKSKADFMIQKGEGVYLISDSPEKETVKTAKWAGIVLIIAGPLMIFAFLFLILLFLNIIKCR
jgi:hypothetical protein